MKRTATAFCLFAVLWIGVLSAPAAPISRGQQAPSLKAPGVVPRTEHVDAATSKSLVVLFVKPDDKHSGEAVETLQTVYEKSEAIQDKYRTVVVMSRLDGEPRENELEIPENWIVLNDTKDSLYDAYQIIATPSTAIIDGRNRIMGFHPGYSPSLANAVKQDLETAVYGEGAVRSPTPTPGMMQVQIGRMLAKRGLWDRALGYYEKAAKEETLPPDILLEQVAILLEMERPEDAIVLLDGMTEAPPDPAVAAELRDRAEKMISGEQAPAEPPTPR